MSGTKPTHELKVKTEDGDYATVGVAWLSKEGWISMKLNPCVVLSYETLKDKTLTLFPVKTKEEWAAYHAQKARQAEISKKSSGEQSG